MRDQPSATKVRYARGKWDIQFRGSWPLRLDGPELRGGLLLGALDITHRREGLRKRSVSSYGNPKKSFARRKDTCREICGWDRVPSLDAGLDAAIPKPSLCSHEDTGGFSPSAFPGCFSPLSAHRLGRGLSDNLSPKPRKMPHYVTNLVLRRQ